MARMNGKSVLLSMAALVVLTSSAQAELDDRPLIDLTYPFDEHTIYWPHNKPFAWEQTSWGPSSGGYWYASGQFCTAEHGGTHLDAPIHFAKDGLTLDEIPLQKLIGPAVVIDVSEAAKQDRDYRMTVADIQVWEKAYGRIPDGAIVLMRTGWGQFWPDRKSYLGSQTPDDAATLHFPGFSKEAAVYLTSGRRIDGIGIDTASMDHGPSRDFIVHQIVNGANVYGLENLANLDQLPPKGATLIVLPMKIKGGSGGPVRVIALLPQAIRR